MRWAAHILNDHIAPDLNNLTECNVTAVEALPNYAGAAILNNVLVAKVYNRNQITLLLGFISHLKRGIDFYTEGRSALSEYIASLPDHDRLDAHAVARVSFESCIIHAYLAVCRLRRFGESLGAPKNELYTLGDGSEYDRLRLINNRIKHFDEDIEVGHGEFAGPAVPVWLENAGLRSSNSFLSFEELAEILSSATDDAKSFSATIYEEFLRRQAGKDH